MKIRRQVALLVIALVLFALLPATSARAGFSNGLQLEEGSGGAYQVSKDVDAVSGTTMLSGTRSFWGLLSNGTAVSGATVGVDSGYAPAGFQAGAPVTSFPVTTSQSSLGPGSGLWLGVGTPLPTSGEVGFDSSRTVDTLMVPLDGLDQTATVTVTLTDPRFGTNPDHYVKLTIDSWVRGAALVSATPPAPASPGETFSVFSNPSGAQFVFGGAFGHTYAFTVVLHVPNPSGVAFAHKPHVGILATLGGPPSCVSGCAPATSARIAEPLLDGGSAGRGAIFASANEALPWSTNTRELLGLAYDGTNAPVPQRCVGLGQTPPVGSTAVLAGLRCPDELAAAPNGDLYFLQSPSPSERVLYRLARGASAPVAVRTVADYAPVAPDAEPPIQSIGFDRRGDVYWLERSLIDPVSRLAHSAIWQLDPRTGAMHELYGADGAPFEPAPLTSGASINVLAVGPNGTAYFAGDLHDATLGRTVGVVYALPRGASAPTLLARFDAVVSNPVAVGGITADAHGHVFALVSGPTTTQLYTIDTASVSTGDDQGQSGASGTGTSSSVPPRLVDEIVRTTDPGGAQPHNFTSLAATPRGDLYVLEQSRTGQTAFGCATSTRYRVLRYAPRTLTRSVVSDATYAGFWATFVPSQAYFRVSRQGAVYFQTDHAAMSCPGPSPFLLDHLVVRGVAPSPTGALRRQTALSEDRLAEFTLWGMPPTYAIGPGGSLYIASRANGTIVRLRN
ncbi:MAG TPA: hypothetical protein VGT60_04915 [Candidatus Limnocylindria bacterium]|nr:hypothetical protein [Candidatus Limnocylindria bacterium]